MNIFIAVKGEFELNFRWAFMAIGNYVHIKQMLYLPGWPAAQLTSGGLAKHVKELTSQVRDDIQEEKREQKNSLGILFYCGPFGTKNNNFRRLINQDKDLHFQLTIPRFPYLWRYCFTIIALSISCSCKWNHCPRNHSSSWKVISKKRREGRFSEIFSHLFVN